MAATDLRRLRALARAYLRTPAYTDASRKAARAFELEAAHLGADAVEIMAEEFSEFERRQAQALQRDTLAP